MMQFEKVTGTPFIGECKNAAFNAPLISIPVIAGIRITITGSARRLSRELAFRWKFYLRRRSFASLGMTDTGLFDHLSQRPVVAPMFAAKSTCSLNSYGLRNAAAPTSSWRRALFITPRTTWSFRDACYMRHVQRQHMSEARDRRTMRHNHIGDLNVVPVKTLQPDNFE